MVSYTLRGMYCVTSFVVLYVLNSMNCMICILLYCIWFCIVLLCILFNGMCSMYGSLQQFESYCVLLFLF